MIYGPYVEIIFTCTFIAKIISVCRSQNFRPLYAELHEICAVVPPGVPVIAKTATVTSSVREDVISKLNMKGCELVTASPDRPLFTMKFALGRQLKRTLHPLLVPFNHSATRLIVLLCTVAH